MTSIEEKLQRASGSDEETRREAIDDLYGLSSSVPNDLAPHIGEFLNIIRNSEDEHVFRNFGDIISTVATSIPTLATDHFDPILDTVTFLADKYPMDDEHISPEGICCQGLLESIRQPLTNQKKFNQALPLFFKLLNKKYAIKYSVMGIISPMVNRNPRIFKDYIPQIFNLVKGGMSEITSLLWQLYKFNPAVYEENIDFLMEMTLI